MICTAEAELAAVDKAEALRAKARGEADKTKITVEAEKVRAAAAEIRYAVKATGNKALNEASNILSDQQISMKIKLHLIENLEQIIRESVKPIQNIDGINIIQVDGLNSGGGVASSAEASNTNSGNLADQVVNSALRYRVQAPLLDSLLEEVGIDGSNINALTNVLKDNIEKVSPSKKIESNNSQQANKNQLTKDTKRKKINK